VSSADTLQGLRVLVVDDEPEVLEVLKRELEELGVADVHTAEDGHAALNVLSTRGEQLDVVLCDWRMPKMSGLDLLRQVRVSIPRLQFVMVTGAVDAASVLAAREAGVNGYIRKPVSVDELRAKLAPLSRLAAQRRPQVWSD
jgi:two-component system, chemotaxis family, chemotaxis protein CheY